MKIEAFNTRGFKAADFVKVIMNDGIEETIQLERGEIYMGSPERKAYLTEEVFSGTPPCIVVQATLETPAGRGIPIADVEDVVLIKSMN